MAHLGGVLAVAAGALRHKLRRGDRLGLGRGESPQAGLEGRSLCVILHNFPLWVRSPSPPISASGLFVFGVRIMISLSVLEIVAVL